MSQSRRPGLSLICLSFLVLAASAIPTAAPGADDAAAATPKWGIYFGGYGMSGRVSTAMLPVGGENYADMNPIERPFGISIAADYRAAPAVRVFFDANVTTYRKQVGVEGEYSESFWVYEMTGYESHYIGPFTDDAYFYMDTVGLRLGFKYDLRTEGARPWFGAGIGLYAWTADYATADRTGSWGSDSGTAVGPTVLLGVDFPVGSSTTISLFGDFMSPTSDPVIENLFHDGWTWDDTEGNHVMGPYRFGVAIGMLR